MKIAVEEAGIKMRSGVRIGVDAGSVRIGIAVCDAAGTLASPAGVIRRDARGGRDLDAIASTVQERAAVEVIVGLPRTLRDREGVAAQSARTLAAAIARRVAPVPVRLVDERLSSVTAARSLRSAGKSARAQREHVDAAAAAVILQSALDAERNSGTPPGEVVTPDVG